MNGDRVTTIVGFVVALLVLSVVVWIIGVEDVLGALAMADPAVVALAVLAAAVWLSAWGMSLWTVLRAVGAPVAPHRAIFTFTAAVFSNNVTPFGQAGGEPVSALLISSVSDSDYETGLAAIASVDTLHFVPSIGLATVGFGYILLSAAELTRHVAVAAVAVAGLAVVVPLAAFLGWHNRYRLESLVIRVFTPISRTIGSVVPRLSPPEPEAVERRIEGFFESVERVASDRRALVTAMSFSALGWLALSTALWLSLQAIGVDAPFEAALLVVPVGSIAGATPLPGGLGGLETAFILLLIPAAGVTAPEATAAVLVHRGATYWLPTIFGGGAATVIGTQSRR